MGAMNRLRGVLVTLIAGSFAFADPALALTNGTLEADSIVQVNTIFPVAIPPPAPGAFSQTMVASPPAIANSQFEHSFTSDNSVDIWTANIAMGAVSFAALASVASNNFGGGGPGAATALGTFTDDLVVNGPAGVTGGGTILLPLHVTGAVGIIANATPLLAEAGFSVFCATSPLTGSGSVCGGSNSIPFSVSVPHAPQFVFDHPQVVDLSLMLTVPFTFGQEFFLERQVWVSAGLDMPECDAPCSNEGTVEGRFDHTGVWGPAIVLDAAGQVVSGATIESGSGIDYLNPTGGTSGPSVPEPGTLAMLLAGCLGLALGPALASVARS